MTLYVSPSLVALFLCTITCVSASEVRITRYVEGSRNVCIVAQFAATFYIDYTDVTGTPQTSTLEVGENAVVEKTRDSCVNHVLGLNFENDRHFEMHFALNGSEACVTRILLSTTIDAVTFPRHADIGRKEVVVFTDPREAAFCTSVNTSYSCNPGTGLKNGSYLLRLSQLRLESFRTSTEKGFIFPESVCLEDRRTRPCTDWVIIIGAVVATIVTCVLLVILLCRMRRRKV